MIFAKYVVIAFIQFIAVMAIMVGLGKTVLWLLSIGFLLLVLTSAMQDTVE